ncbi:MAG: hypothetical protein HQM10_06735 [Candidatus Riflebacteria bacterium]|nr:hypothetical protein [Candidatus Riflebacteria bacterium]
MKESIFKSLADLSYSAVSKSPKYVISVLILLFIFSFSAFSDIQSENEFESIVPDNKQLKLYDNFKKNFAEERNLMISWEISSFEKSELVKLHRLVIELENIPETGKVFSILDGLKKINDATEFENYLRPYKIVDLKDLLREDSFFKKRLVSEDLKAFSVIVSPDSKIPDAPAKLCAKVKKLLLEFFKNQKYHVFGYMYFKDRFFECIAENNRLFITLSFIVCTILGYFFFRDTVILFLILSSVAIPTVYTFAVYFLNGNKVNLFTGPIIPFALIVSLNEIIFIVSFFLNESVSKEDYPAFHEKLFRKLLRPCLVNTLTTLVGFFALSGNPSENIQLFSIYTSLACFFSYIVTFGLVFSFFKLYQPINFQITAGKNRFRGLRKFIKKLVFGSSVKIVAVSIILLIFCILRIPHFEKRNSLEDSFSENETLIQAYNFVKDKFRGPYELHLILRINDFCSAEIMKTIEGLQNEILKVNNVNGVFSCVDLIKNFSQNFSPDMGIPSSDSLIATILEFTTDLGIGDHFISRKNDSLDVRIGIKTTDDFEILKISDKILEISHNILPSSWTVGITGEAYLNAVTQRIILENVVISFVFALILIVLAFYLAFGSAAYSLFSLIVNFFPILIAYMIADFFGLPVNSSTLVVGCVLSGLVVDDTLHIMTFFQQTKNKNHIRRVIKVIDELFCPVIYSSILLGLGNAIFLLSDFKPFKFFGGIGALIVVIGVIGDLLLLPALFLLFSPKKQSGE